MPTLIVRHQERGPFAPLRGDDRRLHISDKTVKRHVSNILSKLHLADRTQAAVWAWRRGRLSQDP